MRCPSSMADWKAPNTRQPWLLLSNSFTATYASLSRSTIPGSRRNGSSVSISTPRAALLYPRKVAPSTSSA